MCLWKPELQRIYHTNVCLLPEIALEGLMSLCAPQSALWHLICGDCTQPLLKYESCKHII